jgi:hypothetical protein
MLNKVVYVPSKFKRTGKMVTKRVDSGERTKGFFGESIVYKHIEEWEDTGFSDCAVDGELLSKDIETSINELNKEGYEVLTITPVISGDHRATYSTRERTSYGYGYGYSYTSGMTIIAKKIENEIVCL